MKRIRLFRSQPAPEFHNHGLNGARPKPVESAPLEWLRPSQLKPYPRNARVHSNKQVRQVADSIARFGFTNPVLVDSNDMILAGCVRVAAAKLRKMDFVPCRRIETMSEAEKRAYVLADNKLALNAGWDEEILAEELKGILSESPDLDISLTGFSIPEIDSLIDGLGTEEPGAPADDILPPEGPARCQPGDLWALGSHRLICGDALDRRTVKTLMDGKRAQMVFTDPPYNVPIQGNVGGRGAIKHHEFMMGSGEMSSTQFTSFLRSAFEQLVEASVDGSIHLVCMDWRHLTEILAAGGEVYSELKNLIVWVKDNGGMGTFYRSRHELIFAFKSGSASHANNFELGQHGRYRTNVWSYKGVNTLRPGRMDELALHPTTKPVQMIADALKDVSRRGAIVLDLFGGSGSTLIAAHKTGRRGYLCEIDPIYCDRILARWETYAKDDAELLNRVPGKQRQTRVTR